MEILLGIFLIVRSNKMVLFPLLLGDMTICEIDVVKGKDKSTYTISHSQANTYMS